MADKISTVVLNVDLECDRCYKKIRRVLCKIQDKANIKTISYDEKNNAVMVSGPFDAEKVCKKLCCKAGRVIREMQIKGKENKESKEVAGDKAKPAKPAEKEAAGGGKADKKDAGAGKGDKKDGGKPEKEAKADKAAAAKPEKVAKDAKPEKKVKFDLEDAPATAPAAMKAGKVPIPAGMTQADLAPLLEKLKLAKQGGPEPPRGEPIPPPMMMVPPAPVTQGVAVPSIWPAPAGSVSCYSYNPAAYDQSSYYGRGYGYGYSCGSGSCRCASCTGNKPGGYYGVAPAQAPAAYDHQGWYYGNRHQYYQQQPCYEDPNAGCSVM